MFSWFSKRNNQNYFSNVKAALISAALPVDTYRWRPQARLARSAKASHHWLASHQPQLLFAVALLSINLAFASGLYLHYRQTVLSFQVAPVVTASSQLRPGQPVNIQIPDQNIDITVESASITNGIWQTSPTNATHLKTSARPGEASNIVVYGHNFKNLFGPLHQAKIGETVTLTTEDGLTRSYAVTDIMTVNPDQIEVVLPTDHEELTLYTCTGFLDSKRLVIKARPTNA